MTRIEASTAFYGDSPDEFIAMIRYRLEELEFVCNTEHPGFVPDWSTLDIDSAAGNPVITVSVDLDTVPEV